METWGTLALARLYEETYLKFISFSFKNNAEVSVFTLFYELCLIKLPIFS